MAHASKVILVKDERTEHDLFTIKHNTENRWIRYMIPGGRRCNKEIVTKIDMASLNSYNATNNYYHNSLSKFEKDYYHVEKFHTIETMLNEDQKDYFNKGDNDLSLDELLKKINEDIKIEEILSTNLSIADKKVNAMLHKIELESINYLTGFKQLKMLLKARRVIKDRLILVSIVKKSSLQDYIDGEVQAKINGLKNRTYTSYSILGMEADM